ncbi:uncharacterized protein [Ciconia boyciana]|uniref:uncharacterized protein n=1 Tax=Ciconia boyciana TaxID=52775 RepID=UPI003BA12C73
MAAPLTRGFPSHSRRAPGLHKGGRERLRRNQSWRPRARVAPPPCRRAGRGGAGRGGAGPGREGKERKEASKQASKQASARGGHAFPLPVPGRAPRGGRESGGVGARAVPQAAPPPRVPGARAAAPSGRPREGASARSAGRFPAEAGGGGRTRVNALASEENLGFPSFSWWKREVIRPEAPARQKIVLPLGPRCSRFRTAVRRLALTTPLGQRHLQAGKFWSSPDLFNPCQSLLSATSA